jgi:hypothetical protein
MSDIWRFVTRLTVPALFNTIFTSPWIRRCRRNDEWYCEKKGGVNVTGENGIE